jgi:hypothetical protein
MFAASSKRARSSTTAVTSLPLRAAATSASTSGDSGPGAVERHLEGEDVGVDGGLAHEVDHGANDWNGWCSSMSPLRAMSSKTSSAPSSGGPCCRRVLQVGPIDEVVDRDDAVQVDRPIDAVELGGVEGERRAGTEISYGLHVAATSSRTASPKLRSCELALHGAEQVVGLFLVDPQVAVARHAELVAPEMRMPGKSSPTCAWITDESSTKSCGLPRRVLGQRDQARQERGTCTTASPLVRP